MLFQMNVMFYNFKVFFFFFEVLRSLKSDGPHSLIKCYDTRIPGISGMFP